MMPYRKMVFVGLICLIVSGIIPIGGVAAQSDSDHLPPVAWIEFGRDGGRLWLFQSETGVSQVSDEEARCATFSPQQTHIVYFTPATVAVMRLSDHEQVIDRTVDGLFSPALHLFTTGQRCPVWLDETSLVFSTVFFAEPYGMPAYNLFHLDINTTKLTEVLPFGEGGVIVPSPNRQYLVILQPGEYADPAKPGQITIIDSTTFQPVNNGFEFAPVATAAEYLWIPTIFWKADSTSFAFGLPDRDLIYSLKQTPPSQICNMTVGEQPAQCQEHAFAFWEMPIFNDQLTRVAYAQRSGADQPSRLAYGAFSPDTPQELSEITFSTTTTIARPILWLDDENLLFMEYPKAEPDLGVVNLATGEVRLWPGESSEVSQPVVALQVLGDGLYTLSVGNYREPHSIGFYSTVDGSFTKLAEVDNFNSVVFADR